MNKKMRTVLPALAAVLLLLGLDQWTKSLAVAHLKGQASIDIIEGVFQLHYLENRGAAFGMMQGQKTFFVIGTLLAVVLLSYFYWKIPSGKRYFPMRLIGVLLFAGACGNLIDRLANDYVVDFLYFELIDFPIFNVADIYVTIGGALLVILFLFYYKDEELEFLSFRKKKTEK